MAKYIILLIGLFVSSHAISLEEVLINEWNSFKLSYNKEYRNAQEEIQRWKIFIDNVEYIIEHNSKYEIGEKTYSLAVNHFADLTHEEFLEFYGLNTTFTKDEFYDIVDEDSICFIDPSNVELPSSVDWRTHGAVTEVKDQGGCGSCWAFSATGALKGQYFRKRHSLISLSEQNLVDCSGSFGNRGCHGGWPFQAFRYVQRNGIDTEREYPYRRVQGSCRYRKNGSNIRVRGSIRIPSGNERILQAAVATKGPISVLMNASRRSFQLYSHGVYYEPSCNVRHLNHAVLAVGYGAERNGQYYIMKNSWGRRWGMGGYMNIARNRRNHCGIASVATFPLV